MITRLAKEDEGKRVYVLLPEDAVKAGGPQGAGIWRSGSLVNFNKDFVFVKCEHDALPWRAEHYENVYWAGEFEEKNSKLYKKEARHGTRQGE